MKKIEGMLTRIKALYNVKTRKELCTKEKMDISLGTYDTWVSRDQIPSKRIEEIAEKFGVHTEWLKTGEGKKYKVEQPQASQFFTPEVLAQMAEVIKDHIPKESEDPRTLKLSRAFDVLPDDVKDEVLKEILPYIIKRY